MQLSSSSMQRSSLSQNCESEDIYFVMEETLKDNRRQVTKINDLDEESIGILLKKGEWLNDLIILKSLYHLSRIDPKLEGFENINKGTNGKFMPINNKFIQILFVMKITGLL